MRPRVPLAARQAVLNEPAVVIHVALGRPRRRQWISGLGSEGSVGRRDLNAWRFVHGLKVCVLKSAEAINNSGPNGGGHIVGTELLNGSPRGFVLEPRANGN